MCDDIKYDVYRLSNGYEVLDKGDFETIELAESYAKEQCSSVLLYSYEIYKTINGVRENDNIVD